MQATSTDSPASRLTQGVLIGATLGVNWLALQIVHEFGHVAAAWACGARVQRVVLHPLEISRTDVDPNPAPLTVAWAGPLVGTAIPCAAWVIARPTAISYLFRFFAGVCLIANGIYLGAGAVVPVGDAADILRLGGTRWTLALFGLIAVPVGFRLWHRLGPSFGLGVARGHVNRTHAWGMATLFVLLIIAELFWSR